MLKKSMEKKCPKCKKVKPIKDFYTYEKMCRECKSKEGSKNYAKNKGLYLYKIVVDGKVRWVGSTLQLKSRGSDHKTKEYSGNFKYACKKKNIDLTNRVVQLWECNLKKLGYGFDAERLKYYEHLLIKYYKLIGESLLNSHENRKEKEEEVYIDNVMLESLRDLPFELSDIKLI